MSRLYIGAVNIGTSGWSYPRWQDCFYTGVARKDWLKFYAKRFSAVEINGTFYHLQNPGTFKKGFGTATRVYQRFAAVVRSAPYPGI